MATPRRKADAAPDPAEEMDKSGAPAAGGDVGGSGPADPDRGDAALGNDPGAAPAKRGRGRPRASSTGAGGDKPSRSLGTVARSEIVKGLADTAGALSAVAFSVAGYYQAKKWAPVSEQAAARVAEIWQIDRAEATAIGEAVAEVTIDLVPDEWLQRTTKVGAVAQLVSVLYAVTARRLQAQKELAESILAAQRPTAPPSDAGA